METGYEQIDATISEWVAKHQLTLFSQTEGLNDRFRCAYLSSHSGECCQIWIDAPAGMSVSLHAADVESRDDEEMRADWVTPVSELSEALDNAVVHVRQWFNREHGNGVRA